MCAFKVFDNTFVLVNTLNISHGHKFTGLLGRRTQVKSFKLTSMSRNSGHKIIMKFVHSLIRYKVNKGGSVFNAAPAYRTSASRRRRFLCHAAA